MFGLSLLQLRVSVRKRLSRIAKSTTRGMHFIFDVNHYMRRGHRFGTSIQLARDTIYH